MFYPESELEYAITGIVVFILLFLLGRELVCWYYKINERVSLLKEHKEISQKILNELTKLNKSQK